jgi:hypothetical protein
MPRGFMTKRSGPVGSRIELAWRRPKAGSGLRRSAQPDRSAPPVQEGIDPGLGSLVVLVLGQDEPPGTAWPFVRRDGWLVGRFGHAGQV